MNDAAPWGDLIRGDTGLATATVSLGVVLFAFNAFIVGTALPVAVHDLGGQAWIAWATSLYLIFSIVSGASSAAVMHRIGARALFLAAGAVFLAGTMAAVLAPAMPVLLAGRALQGAGAGFIEAGCYVLIPRLFPPRLIPKVFGVEAVAWAVAAFGGPALSGLLTGHMGWRWALLATAPMALIFLALVPRVVRGGAEPGPAPGLPLVPLGGIAGGMALILVSDSAGSAAVQAALLAAGCLAFAAVVRLDGRAAVRLLPRGAFRFSDPAGLGLWLALMMPLASASGTVFLTYGMQVLWGMTPLASGLAATVLALSWSGMQTLGAHMGWGRMRLILGGNAALVAGLALVWAAFAGGGMGVLLGAQLVLGAAFGASWGALSQVVMEAAPEEERAVTSGLLPTVMSAGYGIGAALWGLVANARGFAGAEGAALQSALLWVFALATGAALLSAALSWRMARVTAPR